MQPTALRQIDQGDRPEGGTITVGSHRLVIPRGALERKVQITAEQSTGRVNSVRFSPEGLHSRSRPSSR